MKRLLKGMLQAVVAVFGAKIRDQRTGKVVGKALFIPWRGKLHVIGLNEKCVVPVFQSQQRLTYWSQVLTFETHPEPDFPNERKTDRTADPSG